MKRRICPATVALGTVHSLSKLLALYRNVRITLISPPSLMLPENRVEYLARNFKQTDNGVAVHMAIFATRLGVQDQVQHSLREVG